jgi:hypothetical protein
MPIRAAFGVYRSPIPWAGSMAQSGAKKPAKAAEMHLILKVFGGRPVERHSRKAHQKKSLTCPS